ncbi:MFS transporter (plasmid) [Deinococcus sp. KNUC1210]|uniref:MFS transporter n=1 Tax=Deinococcus sp. KNUC1210 TaxID=2917691 RepID=UPI001EEFE0B4|nr:MFS transporter [Deinococcus sp. KNUC1210]ULH17249.1 MFS transporter [Deinococcus sp. KNUC1210]
MQDSAPDTPSDRLPLALARRTMRLSMYEGGFAMFFINWTSGSVLTGYALHLGASDTALGLIASVPLLAQAISPVAAWLAARRGSRRTTAVLCAVVGRGLWLLTPLLAVAPLPGEGRAAALLAVVAVSSLFIAANGALWTAWMGDVVPWKERGRYFGLRTGVLGVVGTLANLLAGFWLDRVAAPLNFQVVLTVAAVMGLLAAVLLTRHDEPGLSGTPLKMRRTISLPLGDPNFRRLLAFAVYWQFAVLIAAPFVLPYFLTHLHMSYVQIAIWGTISAVAAFFLAPTWGRLSDRVGNKPVLAISTFLAGTLLPVSWMVASPGVLWPIWISAVVDALVWSAINPGIFNLSLASTPVSNRAAFIAVFSAATGLSGFVGGLLSGPLLELYRAVTPQTGAWTPYHWLFITSGVFRMLAWTLLRRVEENGAWRTRALLSETRQRIRPGRQRALHPWKVRPRPPEQHDHRER